MNEFLISIISVSYNCENAIEKTIKSLAMQTFKDFEYIVIDGNSSDETVPKIKEYLWYFQKTTVISEPDNGIYDAMNKGIANATGKYVFFLNFGDKFYDRDVLSCIAQKMHSNADIYYGNIQKSGRILKQKNKATLFNCIYREYMICHQSIFAKRELLQRFPFDLQYKLCADRDWLIRVLKEKCSIEYIDKAICVYDTQGQSSNLPKFLQESRRISFKYGGIQADIFIKLKRQLMKERLH